MAEYEIYALKYAGPFTSSGAFLMWRKDWDKTVKRNYYFWCLRGEKETVIVDAGIAPGLAGEKKPRRICKPGGSSRSNRRESGGGPASYHHPSPLGSLQRSFPLSQSYFLSSGEEYSFALKNPIASVPLSSSPRTEDPKLTWPPSRGQLAWFS